MADRSLRLQARSLAGRRKSLDLSFQNESPGADKEANWLPAPKGPFTLTMRMYASRTEALTGKWNPPPVMIVQTVPPLQVQ